LVNLILDQKVVTELIQQDCTVEKMITELHLIAPHTRGREAQITAYNLLKAQLLLQESPSQLVAASMNAFL
jgi:lipid A disaccharide synthetase